MPELFDPRLEGFLASPGRDAGGVAVVVAGLAALLQLDDAHAEVLDLGF